MVPTTTAADSEWETLFPRNGLIVLGPHEQVFSISMFHQLRCLNVIRNTTVERSGIQGRNGSCRLTCNIGCTRPENDVGNSFSRRKLGICFLDLPIFRGRGF
ncbi:hypothetical protein ARMSODRAFT_622999 [Armillaria solidipes]|uniref:Uncharacterized protein n=1 Tax=Armillaria solidipes TaxID=1076256 RepID=A0A2H3ASZ4_9AGAR|nr:hypothetical protein ARMSODRAFT_622999 [Armillaria solidipes]